VSSNQENFETHRWMAGGVPARGSKARCGDCGSPITSVSAGRACRGYEVTYRMTADGVVEQGLNEKGSPQS
jgi:hypothetical protein